MEEEIEVKEHDLVHILENESEYEESIKNFKTMCEKEGVIKYIPVPNTEIGEIDIKPINCIRMGDVIAFVNDNNEVDIISPSSSFNTRDECVNFIKKELQQDVDMINKHIDKLKQDKSILEKKIDRYN